MFISILGSFSTAMDYDNPSCFISFYIFHYLFHRSFAHLYSQFVNQTQHSLPTRFDVRERPETTWWHILFCCISFGRLVVCHLAGRDGWWYWGLHRGNIFFGGKNLYFSLRLDHVSSTLSVVSWWRGLVHSCTSMVIASGLTFGWIRQHQHAVGFPFLCFALETCDFHLFNINNGWYYS